MKVRFVQFKFGFGLLLVLLVLAVLFFFIFNILLIIIPIGILIGAVIWFINLFKKKTVKKDYVDVEFRVK